MTTQPPTVPGHPGEDRLAGFVDGSLEAADRASVEEHLRGCRPCRDQIELAARGFEALRSIGEVSAPAGLADGVMQEIARDSARAAEGRTARWGERWRRVAGVAVAAAVVGLGAFVVLPQLGISGDGATEPGAERAAEGVVPTSGSSEAAGGAAPQEDGGAPAPTSGGPGFERQSVDYDETKLRDLLRQRSRVQAFDASGEESTTLGKEDALACAARVLGGPREPLVHLIQAEWRGTPAYIAIVQRSGDLAAEVIAVDGCRRLETIERSP